MPSWRSKVFGAIRAVARAVAKLDKFGLSRRPCKRDAGWRPVFTAVWVSLFRWRDRGLPYCLISGFKVVGRIGASGVHRPIQCEDWTDEDILAELLGPNAKAFVDDLEADTRVHPRAEAILKCTLEEIDLGLSHPLETREQLDARWGEGNWRPLCRHVVTQNGSDRPIDNGKQNGDNENTVVEETIVC